MKLQSAKKTASASSTPDCCREAEANWYCVRGWQVYIMCHPPRVYGGVHYESCGFQDDLPLSDRLADHDVLHRERRHDRRGPTGRREPRAARSRGGAGVAGSPRGREPAPGSGSRSSGGARARRLDERQRSPGAQRPDRVPSRRRQEQWVGHCRCRRGRHHHLVLVDEVVPSLSHLLRNARLAAGVVLSAALASGCALVIPQTVELHDAWPAALPEHVELADVPFLPQDEYQCGPSALATTLSYSGIAITPEDLVSQVYLPARRGSLQVEMLAAPRKYGIVSYALAPRFEDVLREVAAGNPVIVLQDFGVWPISIWHYSVVVGYDRSSGEVILRSGMKPR